MATRVKLDDIIEALESQTDESYFFLNKQTGEVVFISEEEASAAEDDEPIEDFPEWQRPLIEIAKEIDTTDNYIPLPTKFDIDEYHIMEDFCLSLKDSEMRDTFYNLIKGSGAFRRFKDALYEYDLSDDWHKFHDNALRQIAIEWCKENDIEFDEK
jgi:hypothetical protein